MKESGTQNKIQKREIMHLERNETRSYTMKRKNLQSLEEQKGLRRCVHRSFTIVIFFHTMVTEVLMECLSVWASYEI